MKEYFSDKIKNDIILHSKREYPNESCGLVINDEYIECENIYEDKKKGFRIDKNVMLDAYKSDKLQAVIHSHCDTERSWASGEDIKRQEQSGVPWGIVDLINNSVRKVFFFGDQLPIQDLMERPFVHGVYDCWGLCRDYWRLKGYEIPNFPRDWGWWIEGENVIMENAEKAGFEILEPDNLQPDDLVIARIKWKYPNHCGIYTGDGLVLHHWASRTSLSCKIPYNTIKKYITYIARKREI